MKERLQLFWYHFNGLLRRNFQRYLNSLFKFLFGRYIQLTLPFVGSIIFLLILFHPSTGYYFNSLIDFLKEGSEEKVHNYVILRNIGLFLIGLLGACLAAWRAKSLARQAYIAGQEHMANRRKAATEQLGHEDIMVRIGGLYSLASVAKDSNNEDEIRNIMDILCVFIREKSKIELNPEDHPKEDIQIAITQVTHLVAYFGLLPYYKINLSQSDLTKCNFENAHLIQANFSGANLKSANLSRASLEGANFQKAQLEGVTYTGDTFHMVELSEEQCEVLNITDHKWIKE